MSELEEISRQYLDRTPDREVDAFLIAEIATRVCRDLTGESVIELGVGDRAWTPLLLERFERVISVDGSAALIEKVAEELSEPRWTGVVSMFEDFSPGERAQVVLATYVLEHVDQPELVLARTRTWVRDDGLLVVIVPNSGSLHRRLAQAMGLVEDPTALGDADRRLGHKRVFTVADLTAAVEGAGFTVESVEGFLAKTLPNSLLVHCTDAQLAGLVDLGRTLPTDLAAALCVRARPR